MKIDNKKYFQKKTWILACHVNEIKNTNDYKTLDYFGLPVIIYNINNDYFAYVNVCPHRGSKIKIKKYGNEVFNCIYHGWSYGKDGNLISGPKINDAFTKKQIKNIKLKKIKLQSCGSFLFITESSNKESLEKYLGNHYEKLKKISRKFGDIVFSKAYLWNCNWQVAIENSIDEYHGPILHKNTFKKILVLDPKYSYSKKVSEMNMPLEKKYFNYFKKITAKTGEVLDAKYRHYFIFPISTIATTLGLFCYIQRYIPIDSNNSKIETDIFVKKFNPKKHSISDKFLKDLAIRFNDEVFNEDKEICENLNKNLNQNLRFSIIGKYEERINFFRNLLTKFKIEKK